jgi:HK97 family phage major capsid protein
MSKALIDGLIKRRAERKSELDALLQAPTAETRDLNDEERGKFDAIEKEIREIDERIKELDEQLTRDAAAAEVAKRYKAPAPGDGVRSEPARLPARSAPLVLPGPGAR